MTAYSTTKSSLPTIPELEDELEELDELLELDDELLLELEELLELDELEEEPLELEELELELLELLLEDDEPSGSCGLLLPLPPQAVMAAAIRVMHPN